LVAIVATTYWIWLPVKQSMMGYVFICCGWLAAVLHRLETVSSQAAVILDGSALFSSYLNSTFKTDLTGFTAAIWLICRVTLYYRHLIVFGEQKMNT